MENILEVKNLTVEFEREKIIDSLSFAVRKKDVFIILGPNGAGKTILLKSILNLIPYKGEVIWDKEIRIGYVPQRVPFVKDIPLNVSDFFKLKAVSSKTEKALQMVGIKDKSFLKKSAGELSSGQFQRILIAFELMGDPDVLILDEPMVGIDIEGEETIYSLLKRLRQEKEITIILVTHDLSTVFKEATNVLCINKKKMCYGAPRQVLSSENLNALFGGEINLYKHRHE